MKTKFTIFSLAICAGLQAQTFTEQVIDLGSSYEDDVYHNLSNASGEDEEAKDWHLAFGLGGASASIHFQDAWGSKIYRTTHDLSDWATIDTTGLYMLSPLNNSTTSWGVGALNQDPVDPSSGFDLGWGTYDLGTHITTGNAVFIAEIDGDFYKLFINKLQSGTYTFQHEKMESGASLVQKTIVKSDYSDRNLVHYDMLEEEAFVREPEESDWQFVIGKYIDFAPTAYPVVGVRTRKGIEVAEVANTDPENVDYASLTYSDDINTVGFDWKTFNMSTFSYDLTENLSYVLKEEDGTLHHFYFTAFEGSSTGIVKLMYKTNSVDVIELEEEEAILVANPVRMNQKVSIALDEYKQINVFDQLGNLVKQVVNPSADFSLEFNNTGLYMIQAILGNKSVTQKIIVQ